MGAIRGVPQAFPYQGSKRLQAKLITDCIPPGVDRLIEPFAGSAAVTVAAAGLNRVRQFALSDAHEQLVALWRRIVDDPDGLARDYAGLWNEQLGREREYYDAVRDRFNESGEPHLFLYLLARCVKAAIRYNSRGHFNNSPDNRRLGMRPASMARNIKQVSSLLRGRVRVECSDYREVLADATADDFVYMDPPYQGVTAKRDHRYCAGVGYDSFADALRELNRRGVPYLVSYDGRTGQKVHGRPLPADLKLTSSEVEVGRSTQATLLGRSDTTTESLHLSPALVARLGTLPASLSPVGQSTLFGDV